MSCTYLGAADALGFEPMTAPTEALGRGGYRSAHPGESAIAQFSIRVHGND